MFPWKLIQNVYNITVRTYYKHNAGKRFVLTVSNTVEILFGVRIYNFYWWYFLFISSKCSIARLQDFAPNPKV